MQWLSQAVSAWFFGDPSSELLERSYIGVVGKDCNQLLFLGDNRSRSWQFHNMGPVLHVMLQSILCIESYVGDLLYLNIYTHLKSDMIGLSFINICLLSRHTGTVPPILVCLYAWVNYGLFTEHHASNYGPSNWLLCMYENPLESSAMSALQMPDLSINY